MRPLLLQVGKVFAGEGQLVPLFGVIRRVTARVAFADPGEAQTFWWLSTHDMLLTRPGKL